VKRREVSLLRKVDLIIDRNNNHVVLSAALRKKIERLLDGDRSTKKSTNRRVRKKSEPISRA